LSTIF